MTVAISRRPTGTVTATKTAVHITASDVTENETNGAERVHYMTLSLAGQDTLTSVRFAGDFTWDNVIFPAAGTWAAALLKDSDDSTVTTLSGGIVVA